MKLDQELLSNRFAQTDIPKDKELFSVQVDGNMYLVDPTRFTPKELTYIDLGNPNQSISTLELQNIIRLTLAYNEKNDNGGGFGQFIQPGKDITTAIRIYLSDQIKKRPNAAASSIAHSVALITEDPGPGAVMMKLLGRINEQSHHGLGTVIATPAQGGKSMVDRLAPDGEEPAHAVKNLLIMDHAFWDTENKETGQLLGRNGSGLSAKIFVPSFQLSGQVRQDGTIQAPDNPTPVDYLLRMRPVFGLASSVMLGGCGVADSNAGREMIEKLSALWGVKIAASYQVQNPHSWADNLDKRGKLLTGDLYVCSPKHMGGSTSIYTTCTSQSQPDTWWLTHYRPFSEGKWNKWIDTLKQTLRNMF